jgi:hypothetical protein
VGAESLFEGLNVVAVFGLNQNNQITLLVTGNAPPDKAIDWTLSQSFQALSGTIFDDIHLSNPQFVLSNQDTDSAKQGLSFSGTLNFSERVVFTGPSANLSWLWNNAPPLQIAGSITINDGTPTMTLTASQAQPVSIGYFNFPLTLSLVASLANGQAGSGSNQPQPPTAPSPGTQQQGTAPAGNQPASTGAGPGVDASVQLSTILQYAHNGTTLSTSLSATYQSGQQTLAFAADVADIANTGFPDFASFLFDNENMTALLPANFSLDSTPRARSPRRLRLGRKGESLARAWVGWDCSQMPKLTCSVKYCTLVL